MKIKIGRNDNLPEGEYELTNREKLENALGNLSYGRSDREKLLEYDRIAGRVVKNGVTLPPQSLWKLEQEHMNKPIEDFTDAELLAVIRRAENTDVPGSLYQRANNEWQMRQNQKLVNAVEQGRSGIFFEVGGDMTNHGTIHTARDSVVDVAVAGDYSSNNQTKIIQGELRNDLKEWYEKPVGIILVTAIAGIIVGGVLYYMRWS